MGIDVCVSVGYGFILHKEDTKKFLNLLRDVKQQYLERFIDETFSELTINRDSYEEEPDYFICLKSSEVEILNYSQKRPYQEIKQNIKIKTETIESQQLSICKSIFEKYQIQTTDINWYSFLYYP